jgi:hypothetical protein
MPIPHLRFKSQQTLRGVLWRWSECVYGVGNCTCDRLDFRGDGVYDPEYGYNYMAEHMETSCP